MFYKFIEQNKIIVQNNKIFHTKDDAPIKKSPYTPSSTSINPDSPQHRFPTRTGLRGPSISRT